MLEGKLGSLPGNMNEGEVSSYCGASDGRDILSAADVTAVEANARLDSSTHEGCERTLEQIASFNGTDQFVESRLEYVGKDVNQISDQKDLDQGTCYVLMETKYQTTTVSKLEELGKEDEVKREYKNKDKHVDESSESTRLTKRSKNTDSLQQNTNMDLEDGSCDTLKAARLVAKITGSQQRQDFLNVDLNVAEDGDGVNHMSAKGKQILLSGEYSDELSSDVNQSEEDENVPSSNSNDSSESSDSNPSSAPSVTLSDNRDGKRKRVGKTLPSTFSFNTYITERIDALNNARAEAIKVMKAKLELEEAMLELKKKKLERQMDTMMIRMPMKILNTSVAKQNLTPDEETMKLKLINKLFP